MGYKPSSPVFLGDIILLEDSKREPLSSMQRASRKGQYPYYGAQGIVDYLSDYTFEGKRLLVAEDGENLRSRKLPIANSVDGKFRVNNHAHVLCETSKCNIDYLRFYLNSTDISAYITGSTQPKLSQTSLLGMRLDLPPKEKQDAIVSFLAAIERKINLNTRLNGYLAEIADALFTDAFGNLEDNAVLSDIAKITMGQSPAGTSYNEEGVGTVFYQGRGEFGWRYPTQRLFTTEPKRMAKSGDVLMSVRAPVGDLNLAYEDCCIGRGLVAISCDYPSYCLYLMRSLGKKLDAYNGEGTVFGSISGNALKGIGIGLPGNDDIAAFEAMVAPIDDQIRCNETESRFLSQLRDALLPKLMSGEIDVSKVDLKQLNSHLA